MIKEEITGLEKVINLIESISLYVASAILIIMSLLIATDTFFRYFFNNPIIGVLEVTESFFMVAIVYFGMSYTYTEGDHIKVDLFNRFLPSNVKFVTGIILNIIAICFFLIIGIQSWKQAMIALELNQTTTGAVQLPMAPAYFLVVIGVFLLCTRLLLNILKQGNKKGSKGGI